MKPKKLKTENYVLPSYYACALINSDFSGLEEEDVKILENFINSKMQKNHRFYCINCSEESFFQWSNDASNLGADCLNYTFDVSKI